MNVIIATNRGRSRILYQGEDPLLPRTRSASGVKWSTVVSIYIYIREYGSTLYVGLARAVSPTNTNFRLTFLLTRLQEALYEDLAV